jgi:hypothetical protein
MSATANRTVRRVLLGLGLFLAAASAHAQATRTWVSGVGDDANPCSRTAPCKTFAGAISKTAAGGIINVLDPGGFGAVTVTKSITIDGGPVEGSILASGTNGVIVNAGATDIVTLRNLTINGTGTTMGYNGIKFLAGSELHVENVNISNFRNSAAGNGWGILVSPSTAGIRRIYVENCTIQDNGATTTGGGIHAIPTNGANVYGVIRNSHITNNYGNGVRVGNNAYFTIDNANISGNKRTGVFSLASTGWSDITMRGSTISDSGWDAGASAIQADGANAYIQIGTNVISNNEIGLLRTNGGHIESFGDNQVTANGTDGTPSNTITEL